MVASTVSERIKDEPLEPEQGNAVRLPGGRDGRDPERAIKRGPSRVPREYVLATQRDRLYDGIVRTVAAHGYTNATVTEICRAAGVTRPAFYEHFDGKEAAFLAAYTHGTDLLLATLEHAYAERGADWRDTVWHILEILLDVLRGTPAFASMAIVEVEAAGIDARRKRMGMMRRFRGLFADAPQLPAQVDRVALVDAVIGGVYSSIYQEVALRGAAELPRLLPVLGYFVLAPFGLDARPPSADDGRRGPRVVLPCTPLFLTADES